MYAFALVACGSAACTRDSVESVRTCVWAHIRGHLRALIAGARARRPVCDCLFVHARARVCETMSRPAAMPAFAGAFEGSVRKRPLSAIPAIPHHAHATGNMQHATCNAQHATRPRTRTTGVEPRRRHWPAGPGCRPAAIGLSRALIGVSGRRMAQCRRALNQQFESHRHALSDTNVQL